MSSEDVRVSLTLKAGDQTEQIFRDILVKDRNCTLAEFLDLTLKALEVRVLTAHSATAICTVHCWRPDRGYRSAGF